MAALTEDIVKDLLSKAGAPVPQGYVVSEEHEVGDIQQRLGSVVLKALVPTGRRGKAGAIKFADDAQAAVNGFKELKQIKVYGFPVNRVLIEEKIKIRQEYFLSFTFDRVRRKPALLISTEGGVEIEEIVKESPEKLFRHDIDPATGLHRHNAIYIWAEAGLAGKQLLKAADITVLLYQAFVQYDLSLLEINPLCITKDDEILIVAAMGQVDDDALYRQREIKELVDRFISDFYLTDLTPLERQVAEANISAQGTGTVRYREIEDGEIGLLTGGAGAGLVIFDTILKHGGKPANFSDIGAGSVAERLLILFKTILSKKGIKALLIAFNILNLGRADLFAGLMKELLREFDIDPTKFPVVVRLAGPGEDVAREECSGIPGIKYYGDDITLEEAAREIVEMVRGAE